MAAAVCPRTLLVMLLLQQPPAPLATNGGGGSCTDQDFPHDYSTKRIFGAGMTEDPFAASSPAACREACCALQGCQAFFWDYSQVSGPNCHYGQGFAIGLRRGQINATVNCDRARPEWSCNYSRTARSRAALPPVPEHPPPPPHRKPPPPPPPQKPTKAPAGAKNVLLLVADDMRPDLPMYGNPIVHAPNLQVGAVGTHMRMGCGHQSPVAFLIPRNVRCTLCTVANRRQRGDVQLGTRSDCVLLPLAKQLHVRSATSRFLCL